MLRIKALIASLSILMFAPLIAYGQGGASGSITGYAYDQTGVPLKGIKVTASSPTQIGGSKVAYTNDEGFFRIPALFPGKFELKATAPKMKTYIQKDIPVGLTSAVELSIIMDVEAQDVDQVTVVEKAPLVSTTTSNVKESYDLDFVETLPMNSRDQVHTQMINEVAGSLNGRMRGGASNMTLFMQDGFELNQNNGTYPVLKSSAAFEIQTGGYGADGPTAPGGMINLVTKSGSNRLEFEFNATADMDQLRLFKQPQDERAPQSYYILAPMIAGPIVKDKLWFFFTDEFHFITRGRPIDVEGYFPDPPTYTKFIHKGTFKLTWQINARNKLSSLTNFEVPIWEHNQVDGLGVDASAQQNRWAQRYFSGLIYETLLTDSLILRVQPGIIKIQGKLYPRTCIDDPGNCNFIPSQKNNFPRTQFFGNRDSNQSLDYFSYQVVNQLQWFPSAKLLGEHGITLRDRIYAEEDVVRQSHPGDALYEWNGTGIRQAMTTYYSNDPRYENARYGWFISTARTLKHTATISDAWRPTRYTTLTPSISHVLATGSNSRGDQLPMLTAFVPGVSGAWDATHDGKTVIRGSASSYVDADLLGVARHGSGASAGGTAGSNATQPANRCEWDDTTQSYTKNCVFSGGPGANTYGLPCGPSGKNPDGTSCKEDLKLPRTYEATLGGEREVTQGLALALDVVVRQFNDQFDGRESNQIWNDSGTQVIGYRSGKNEKIVDLSNPSGASRYYRGVTFAVNKREGRFRTHVSYTWSKQEGTMNAFSNEYGDIPGRDIFLNGPINDDHRHELKMTAQWQATRFLTLGARYDYISGLPYSRKFITQTGSTINFGQQYKAMVGVNPGNNINDPADDRELRLPDRQDVNIQVRLNMMPLIGQQLDFYVDVLNALALHTVTDYGTDDGRDFGVERGWVAPFRVRLGLNYRY